MFSSLLNSFFAINGGGDVKTIEHLSIIRYFYSKIHTRDNALGEAGAEDNAVILLIHFIISCVPLWNKEYP